MKLRMRLLSVLLAVALAFTSVDMSVYAADFDGSESEVVETIDETAVKSEEVQEMPEIIPEIEETSEGDEENLVEEEVNDNKLLNMADFGFYLDANGGQFYDGSFVVTFTAKKTWIINTPSREGYIFGGWYFNRECTDDARASVLDKNEYLQCDLADEDDGSTDKAMVRLYDKKTLYAKWLGEKSTIPVKIIFGLDNIENEPTTEVAIGLGYYRHPRDFDNPVKEITVDVPEGELLTEYFYQGNVDCGDYPHYAVAKTTHEGRVYTSIGGSLYYTKNDMSEEIDISTLRITAPITLYKKYYRDNTTVTYHARPENDTTEAAYFNRNGEETDTFVMPYSNAMIEMESEEGFPVGYSAVRIGVLNKNPKRVVSGYYYYDNGLRIDKPANYGIHMTPGKDMDVYIEWTDDSSENSKPKLTYHANGGSIGGYFVDQKTGEKKTDISKDIHTDGGIYAYPYVFDYDIYCNNLYKSLEGWATTPDAKTPEYDSFGAEGSFQTSMDLYPVWSSSQKYRLVKFHANGGKFPTNYSNLLDEDRTLLTKQVSYGDEHGYGLSSSDIITDIKVSRDGYSFGGWYYDEELTEPVIVRDGYISEKKYLKDYDLYAKWIQGYKVTFDYKGGKDSSDQTKAEYTVSAGSTLEKDGISVPSNPTSEDGKVFAGWYTDSACTNLIEKDDILDLTITEDVTFYAKYQSATTVTFNAKDGYFPSNKKTIEINLPVGTKLGDKAPVPEIDGDSAFDGWYTDEACTTFVESISDYVVTETAVTFYAKYSDCYTLTFHANRSGTRLDGVSETIAVKVPKGKAFTYSNYKGSGTFNTPTMDRRTYGKIPMFYLDDDGASLVFATNKNGTGTQYIFGKNYHVIRDISGGAINTTAMPETGFVPTSNLDLYVVWADAVEVTFVSGAKSFTESFKDGMYTPELTDGGDTYKEVVAKGTLLNDINTQYKFGYNNYGFTAAYVSGWYIDSTLKQVANSNLIISANTSIYAKWSTYNNDTPLYFHANEGYFGTIDKASCAVERTGAAKERVSISIPVSRDNNKVFAGWYTDSKLTNSFNGDVSYKDGMCYITVPSSTKHLYAKFDIAQTVTLNANGGFFTGKNDPTSVIKVKEKVAGQGINLSTYENRLTRIEKLIFAGWYKDSALTQKANAVIKAVGEEYYIPAGTNENLYAKWIPYKDTDIIIEGADSYTLAVGQSISLNVKVSNADMADGVCFVLNSTSGDSHPISIDNTGKITALATGEAVLYAAINGKISNKVSIKVVNAKENIVFKVNSLNLLEGESYDLAVDVYPAENASNLTFTSSNSKLVKVEGNKIIAQAQEGSAKITAKAGSATAVLEVNVTSPIKLSNNEAVITAKEGVEFELTPIIAGQDNLSKEVEWTIDNPTVLTKTNKSAIEKGIILKPATNITEKVIVNITAKLAGTEYSDTCKLTIFPVLNVSAPKADIAPGVVKAGTRVQLSSDTYLADIYYTLVGNQPTTDSTLYTDAIVINKTTTIKAIAVKDECKESEVATFTYTVNTNDWGDVSDDLKPLFDNVSTKVPQGMWFVVGDRDKYYTQGGQTTYIETYTGNNITFNNKVEVYQGTTKLVEKRDYSLSYVRNKVVATQDNLKKAPIITVTGKGNYTSKAQFTFTIAKANLDEAKVTSERSVAVNMGKNVKLASTKPVYSFNGKKLSLNKDYVLKYYKNSVEATNEIAVPTKEIINDATVKYYVVAVAKDGSNFENQVTSDNYVEIKPIDKSTTLMATRLKAVDAKGKAIKINYNANQAVDLTKLFDNSNGKSAEAFIKDGSKILVYGQDYKINTLASYDYKSAGKHSFVVEGLQKNLTADDVANKVKNYAGTKTLTFEIVGTALKKVKIAGLLTSVEYTGKEITLSDLFNAKDKKLESGWNAVTLYLYNPETKTNTVLVKDTDYMVSMENNGNIGKFSLVFTGINGYSGTIKKTIIVKAYNFKNDNAKKLTIDVLDTPATYCKAGVKPQVNVVFDGDTLKEGVDYTLSYKNNGKIVTDYTTLKSGKPTVTVKGKGNYTGSNASAFFNIKKADIAGVTISLKDVAYNAKSSGKNGYFMKATPKLLDDGKAISVGKNKDVEAFKKTDYIYTYAYDSVLEDGTKKYAGTEVKATDKVAPGTVIKVNLTVRCSEKSPYISDVNGTTLTGYYRIINTATDISKFTVKIKALNKLAFNDSKAIMPLKSSDLEVTYKKKVGGKNTTVALDSSDYEIVSITNNKLIGKATVVIRGKNEYGGQKTFTFNIKAKSFAK